VPALPIGAPAPDFILLTISGETWSPRDMRGQPFALVFSDPECPPCVPFLARLAQVGDAGVVLVSRGDAERNRRAAAQAGITAPVLLQRNREMARAFGLLDTPSAYAIDAEGRIAAGPAIGEEEVLSLMSHAYAHLSNGPSRGMWERTPAVTITTRSWRGGRRS
jgi:peroxiredoxin